MKLLVIDTSQKLCSVALMDESNLYYKDAIYENGHSRVLFSLIDFIFEESGYDYSAITNIGVVVGPGSFTGIRAGIAAVRGMNLILRQSLHGISIFEMQAYYISSLISNKIDNYIKTVFHARNNSVYVQIFNNELLPITEIMLDDGSYDEGFILEQHILDSILNARLACLALHKKLINNLKTIDSSPIYLNTLFVNRE